MGGGAGWGDAERFLKAGKYDEARASLLALARTEPTNAALFNNLGTACLYGRRIGEAIAAFQRSIALKPGVASTHFNLGLAFAQKGDVEGALAAHRRATEVDPAFAASHGRVGDILVRKGLRAEGAAAYARAYAAAPESSYGRLCRAKELMQEDRVREAEECLQALVAADNANTEAYLVLGNLLIEAGRFDEAAKNLERSIVLAPWQTTAYHGLVSSRRITEADRPLVARMEARAKEDNIASRQRMLLQFAVGKAKDDLRDYAGAIAQFDAANAIRRRLTPFDRAAFAKRVDGLIARYPPARFAARAAKHEPHEGDERPVFVLGMPRSGTTLIERIVSSHRQVRGGGELPFWGERAPAWADVAEGESARGANQLRADYLAVLERIAPDTANVIRVTDKMPSNFLWIGLIHETFPKARIIHCRRNPVDTCLSIYMTYFAREWGFASDRGDLVAYYRQYLRLMDHWRTTLPADRFLDVSYEETTAAPEENARRLIAFCGLPWDEACARPEQNPDAVRTANKWEARQPVYRSSVERWRNYEPWIGELKELLEG